jgi:large subunit ribosomal protein L4
MKVDVTTLDAGKAGSIDLDDAIYGITEIRGDILQRMVKYQLAKRRAGTQSAKTRSEVNRSHSKMYKQKGTGRARHHSANAPIFRGGGMAHAVKPRDYAHGLTKKVRAMALRHALSSKVLAQSLIVIDEAALKESKTAAFKAKLAKLGLENALIVGGETVDRNLALAARNIPNIEVLPYAGLNVYDVLRRKKLVLTKAAIAEIAKRFDTAKKEAA